MKPTPFRLALIPLALALLLATACQTPPAPTATPLVDAPTDPAPPDPIATEAAPPTAEIATEESPTSPTEVPTPTPPVLPAPQLFATAFDDRTPYQAGLRDSAEATHPALDGAPVYHLDLTVSDDLQNIGGQLEVAYTNQEDVALNEIYFHQFPNLLGGRMSIENVAINGSAVDNAEDHATIVRIPLATPLEPGQQAVISLDFNTMVPTESGRNYGILAYVDDILALAHFYPMLAVYDQNGWDTEPAPDGGDVTYADTSFFQVRLNAPADQVIATSGIETEREQADGRQIVSYAAGPVRDFYVAMSNQYEQVSAEIDGITINSYAPASLLSGAEATLDFAAEALTIFGERYGPYPYTEFDMVGTPTLALGVEYPGIIANTLGIYDLNNPARSTWLETTTVHEVGHQWFYNILGNDQLDAPWLDESLTQFATWQYFEDRYGNEGGEGALEEFELRWSSVENAEIPIGQPVEAYGGREYSGIVYGRGPLFFHELRATIGEDAFDRFLTTYTEEQRWGIVSAEIMQTTAENACNCNLSVLFEEWIGPK